MTISVVARWRRRPKAAVGARDGDHDRTFASSYSFACARARRQARASPRQSGGQFNRETAALAGSLLLFFFCCVLLLREAAAKGALLESVFLFCFLVSLFVSGNLPCSAHAVLNATISERARVLRAVASFAASYPSKRLIDSLRDERLRARARKCSRSRTCLSSSKRQPQHADQSARADGNSRDRSAFLRSEKPLLKASRNDRYDRVERRRSFSSVDVRRRRRRRSR